MHYAGGLRLDSSDRIICFIFVSSYITSQYKYYGISYKDSAHKAS